jgi:hypothetical protein
MTVFSKMSDAPVYEKMEEYIQSIFDVFQMIHKKAVSSDNKRLQMISILLFNYLMCLTNQHKVEIKKDEKEKEYINLIPVFEYVAFHQIELYEFDKIEMSDVDTNKKEDLERFVLTHVYYLTQSR